MMLRASAGLVRSDIDQDGSSYPQSSYEPMYRYMYMYMTDKLSLILSFSPPLPLSPSPPLALGTPTDHILETRQENQSGAELLLHLSTLVAIFSQGALGLVLTTYGRSTEYGLHSVHQHRRQGSCACRFMPTLSGPADSTSTD